MHKILHVCLVIASMTSAAIAQCEEHPAVPVTNAPYSAVRRVITTKRNADGTTSRSESTQREARDGKGRSYRAGERGKGEMLVRVSDPVSNTETTWGTTRKIIKVVHLPSSNAAAPANHPNVDAFSFDAAAKRLNGTTLGSRTIEGISVQGIRYETGESTHECWFSPELKTVVLMTDEYKNRSFTDQLENIRLGEPDVSSYRPPSGYWESHVYLEESGRTNVR